MNSLCVWVGGDWMECQTSLIGGLSPVHREAIRAWLWL